MKKLFRLFVRLLLVGVLITVGILAVRTVRFPSRQIKVAPVAPIAVAPAAVERFTGGLQFPTISGVAGLDTSAFLGLDSFIHQSFPMIDSVWEEIPVTPYSLVLKWPGTNPGLSPILWLGHLDVVPPENKAAEGWTVPPFSGRVQDGYIWGRGTLDDKINIFAILEACTQLVIEDYQPNRSIYFAFGHDEEIGGSMGAMQIAAHFAQQGLTFEYVLDEGSIILEEALPGLEQPLAMIGIAEKTSVTLQLSVALPDGGHSSMPPPETAVGILSRAIDQLQQHPFPASIAGTSRDLLEYTGPELQFPYNMLFANLWLTEGLLIRQFSQDVATNAIVRTTTAPTMISGGVKDNVLPSTAQAIVNFRVLPEENMASVLAYVEKTIADNRISVTVVDAGFGGAVLPPSSKASFGYQVLQKTIQQVFPEVVVAPSLVIGATDSRHYASVTQDIYRFMPVQLNRADLKRIHGKNERISVDAYAQAIRFYRQLLLNSSR